MTSSDQLSHLVISMNQRERQEVAYLSRQRPEGRLAGGLVSAQELGIAKATTAAKKHGLREETCHLDWGTLPELLTV